MKENEYKCGYCKGVFEKGWTDDESKKEAEIIFGKHPDNWKDKQVIVCDDCFTQMYPPMYPSLLEVTKKYL